MVSHLSTTHCNTVAAAATVFPVREKELVTLLPSPKTTTTTTTLPTPVERHWGKWSSCTCVTPAGWGDRGGKYRECSSGCTSAHTLLQVRGCDMACPEEPPSTSTAAQEVFYDGGRSGPAPTCEQKSHSEAIAVTVLITAVVQSLATAFLWLVFKRRSRRRGR